MRQDDVEDALADSGLDALVVEASANLEETKRLVESPMRPQRAPLLLLVRADQLPAIDADLAGGRLRDPAAGGRRA